MPTVQQKTRERVRHEYDNKCPFCGMGNEDHIDRYGQSLDTHHKVKLRHGGTDSLDNLIPVCRPCHQELEMAVKRLENRIVEDIRMSPDEDYVLLPTPLHTFQKAKEQREAAGRTWGEQIVRPDGVVEGDTTTDGERVEAILQAIGAVEERVGKMEQRLEELGA